MNSHIELQIWEVYDLLFDLHNIYKLKMEIKDLILADKLAVENTLMVNKHTLFSFLKQVSSFLQ